jgi:hypothetical protein
MCAAWTTDLSTVGEGSTSQDADARAQAIWHGSIHVVIVYSEDANRVEVAQLEWNSSSNVVTIDTKTTCIIGGVVLEFVVSEQ